MSESEWVWIRHPNLPDAKPARVPRDAFDDNWGLDRTDDEGNFVPGWEIVDDAYGRASQVLGKNVTEFESLSDAERTVLANAGVDAASSAKTRTARTTASPTSANTGGDV